jgi:hypothetical protein
VRTITTNNGRSESKKCTEVKCGYKVEVFSSKVIISIDGMGLFPDLNAILTFILKDEERCQIPSIN